MLPLLFFIHEPKQEFSQESTNISHIKKAFFYIQEKTDVLYMILILAIISSIGNIYWFTYQPYLKGIGFTITYVGIAFAIASACSALGTLLLKNLQQRKFMDLQILQYLILALLLSSLGFYFFISHPSLL